MYITVMPSVCMHERVIHSPSFVCLVTADLSSHCFLSGERGHQLEEDNLFKSQFVFKFSLFSRQGEKIPLEYTFRVTSISVGGKVSSHAYNSHLSGWVSLSRLPWVIFIALSELH